MRLGLILATALTLVAAGCDRLPARGGEGQACFGNGSCEEGLSCDDATFRCCPPEGCACTPDCLDKCDGAFDGCGGTCETDCAGGFWCVEQNCVACVAAESCGEACTDCTAQAANRACIDDDGTWRCGCASDADCASGACGPDGSCETCEPMCDGAQCGQLDGCGGVCIVDSCKGGFYCQGDATPPCQPCDEQQHCGDGCLDCTTESAGNRCFSPNEDGVFYCGCKTDSDCDVMQSCNLDMQTCLGDPCITDDACGAECEDCTVRSSGKVCVPISGGPGWTCGCSDATDCDQGLNEQCLDGACLPEGALCGDDLDCHGVDCTQKINDKVCVDETGEGQCRCGCVQGGDCDVGYNCNPETKTCEAEVSCTTDGDCSGGDEICFQGACCLPTCGQDYCGSDGCGGTCACPAGSFCESEACAPCAVDYACGTSCSNCAASINGNKCIQPAVAFKCGCEQGGGNCLSGYCLDGTCTDMSLLYVIDASPYGCAGIGDVALADLTNTLGAPVVAVACTGGQDERPVLIWLLDGVAGPTPDFVLTSSGIHRSDLSAVAFDENTGDLFSADISGMWRRWVWNQSTNDYDPPIDLNTVTSTDAYFLRASTGTLHLATAATSDRRSVNVFDPSLYKIGSVPLGAGATAMAFDGTPDHLLVGSWSNGGGHQGLAEHNISSDQNTFFGLDLDVRALDLGNGFGSYLFAVSGYEHSAFQQNVVLFFDALSDTFCQDCDILALGTNEPRSLVSIIDDSVIYLGLDAGQMTGYKPVEATTTGFFAAHPGCAEAVEFLIDRDNIMASACGSEVRIWSPGALVLSQTWSLP